MSDFNTRPITYRNNLLAAKVLKSHYNFIQAFYNHTSYETFNPTTLIVIVSTSQTLLAFNRFKRTRRTLSGKELQSSTYLEHSAALTFIDNAKRVGNFLPEQFY